MEQPLPLLVKMEAIDLVFRTMKYMASEDADWKTLTVTQVELIKWIEHGIQTERYAEPAAEGQDG